MRKLRVLVLMHEGLVPPDDIKGLSKEKIAKFKTEYHVVSTLKKLGHQVKSLGVRYELVPIRRAVTGWKPHIVFNLLEEFRDEATYDHHMVAYLELMRVAYTGCNPRGLVLSRDKGLSKKILTYHRIPTPRFTTVIRGRKARMPREATFPLIVKSLNEEASMGISQASVVDNEDKLADRVRFVHERVKTDALVEEFIHGRELYVSVIGNRRLQVLPPWELFFKKADKNAPIIATEKAKWDLEYQKKWGIDHGPAKNLPDDLRKRLEQLGKRIYRRLGLAGYARLDFRLSEQGQLYFLEANPNPDVAADEELALASRSIGLKYPELLQKLLSLGLRR